MYACEALAIATQGDTGDRNTSSNSMSVADFVMLCTYMRQTNTSPQAANTGDQIDELSADIVSVKDSIKVLERFHKELPQLLVNMIHYCEDTLEASRTIKRS